MIAPASPAANLLSRRPGKRVAHRLLTAGWLIPGCLALAFFCLYVDTLAPDVVGHDAGEFQFVPYIFGVPHITGYPLQLVIGKLWSFLPLGSVAWRMNLLSAVVGAIAVALVYRCGLELTGSRIAGAVAALATGLAPLEWTWSSIAGVRSPTTAFVAAVLFVALRWRTAVQAGVVTLANRRLLLLAFTFGLALDHHRTILLLLPFLFLYIALIYRPVFLNAGLLSKAVGLAVAPLILYGVLPLRAALGAPWDQLHTATWHGFVNLTIAGSDSGAHFDLTTAQAMARIPMLLQALAGSFSPLVLLFAVIGVVWLTFRRDPVVVLLAGYILVLAWLTLEWHLGPDLNLVYFMPAYVPLALLAAAGFYALGRFCYSCEIPSPAKFAVRVGPGEGRVRVPNGSRMGISSSWLPRSGMNNSEESAPVLRSLPIARPSLALALNGVVLLAVTAGGLYVNRARFGPQPEVLDDFRVDLFQGHQARRLVDGFAQLPPNSTVVADWDQASALWYGQFVDGYNRTAAISYPTTTLPDVFARASGPVFLATATLHPSVPAVTAAGPFVQVLRQPLTATPPDMRPIGGSFDSQIQLAGLAPIAQPNYDVLPVTIYWKALRQPPADYAVSVRLMPDASHVASQRDEAAPVLGLSQTSRWQPGQVTADYYELDLRDLGDGQYTLAVVMYQPLPGGGFRNLAYGSTDRATLGQLGLSKGKALFTPAAQSSSGN